MLQRIQSVWLLLASVCAFLTLRFSTYSGTNKALIPSSFLKGTENIGMMSVTLAVGIISLIIIFLFSNRQMQFWLVILCIVLEALLVYLYYREISLYINGAISLSALLHPAIIIFLVLAAKGINADEKLIKDSDRLR